MALNYFLSCTQEVTPRNTTQSNSWGLESRAGVLETSHDEKTEISMFKPLQVRAVSMFKPLQLEPLQAFR